MLGTPVPKSRVSLGGGQGAVRLRRGTGGRVVSLRRGATYPAPHGATFTMLGRKTAGEVRLKQVPANIAAHPNATWVHLVYPGEWKGHPAGDFTFDATVFSQIVRNFEATRTPVPFKYEHPDPKLAQGQPIPSAGKIHDLKVNEAGLWAFVKFTDRAAEMIRAEEYEYCSVVVLFDSEDRKTAEPIGAELLEVGLTDNPFIDGQEPIRLPALSEAA